MTRQSERARRLRRNRRRATTIAVLVAAVVAVVFAFVSDGSSPPSHPTHGAIPKRTAGSTGPDSLEAGIEPWQVSTPLSRESVVATGAGLTVLGGISAEGNTLSNVSTINVRTGALSPAGGLAEPVHDAAAATIGSSVIVLGGGSPDTVSAVQSLPSSSGSRSSTNQGMVTSNLPQPRSDLAIATVRDSSGALSRGVTFIVGGYDGTNYLPTVLSTVDGVHFSSVGNLRARFAIRRWSPTVG